MTQLSETSVKLLKVIRDSPGLHGDQIRHFYLADDPQTANNLKLLEQHGYINYLETDPNIGPGWFLTVKGTDVLKYG